MKNATLFALINAKGGGGGSGDGVTIVDTPDVNGGIIREITTTGESKYKGIEQDVNFIDYDGSIVTSYKASEFANLTEMPANPTHKGLTAQGWNWSLSDAKTYVATYGQLWIGQMYITDDGKTRLYIHLENIARNVVPLYWNQSVSEGVTINWGDGSAEETAEGTGNVNTTHTYTSAGDYVITLDVTSGTAKLGGGTSSYAVLGSTGTAGRVYLNMLQKVEIGDNMTLQGYAFSQCHSLVSITVPSTVPLSSSYMFYNCYSLKSITMTSVGHVSSSLFYNCKSLATVSLHKSIQSIEYDAFYGCSAIKSITIPSGIGKIYGEAFNNCMSLANVIIPNSATQIQSDAFRYCESLSKVTIPSNVTLIGSDTFGSCYGIKEYHILRTSPPTLQATSAFSYIASDCIIYVPYSADHSILASYKSASNWATYADYMQEEPQ